MSSPSSNPYSWTVDDAQRLGYVDLDLSTLKLDRVVSVLWDTARDLPFKFRDDLVRTSQTVDQIKHKYEGTNQLAHLRDSIVQYFLNLQARLQNDSTRSYRRMFDSPHEMDFCSIGARFWDWLVTSGQFSDEPIRSYSILIWRYLQLFPGEILELKSKLAKLELEMTLNYFPIRSEPSLELICEILQQELSDLKSVFVQIPDFGHRKIDYYQLSFGIVPEQCHLDAATKSQAAYVVLRILKSKFGIVRNYCFASFNRIEIRFNENRQPKSLNIYLSTELAVFFKLVSFYIKYDYRFEMMVLVLKHWFAKCNLIKENDHYDATLLWLVMHFLQRTDPPVLPKVEQFLLLQVERDEYSSFMNDPIRPSENCDSVGQLILKFILHYYRFNFVANILNGRDGSVSVKLDQSLKSSVCIEDPFLNRFETGYTICDAFRWKESFGRLLFDVKITPGTFLSRMTMETYVQETRSALKPIYMERKPENPFLLDASRAKELQYPEELKNLVLPHEPTSTEGSGESVLEPYSFFHDFIASNKSISGILVSYNRDHLHVHHKNVLNYFHNLQAQLQLVDFSTEKLLHSCEYDFASYGTRFWEWLVGSGFYPEDVLRNFSILIYRYLTLIPVNILKLRTQILDLYVIFSEKIIHPKLIDYNLVNYQAIDQRVLYESVRKLKNLQEQIECILNKVYRPNQAAQLVEIVNSFALKLHDLKLCFTQLGSLYSSGLSIYSTMNSFDFGVSFGVLPSGFKLDSSTLVLAFQLIGKLIKMECRLDCSHLGSDRLVSDFSSFKQDGSSSLECYQATFSIDSKKMEIGKVIEFYAKLDRRFREMVLILQYWIKLNDLIGGKPFQGEDFVWMIVFFLQNGTNPPVLPSVERILKQQHLESPINTLSTSELIVLFLKFYSEFNYNTKVISPRTGQSYSKQEYQATTRSDLVQLDLKDLFVIECPISGDLIQLNNFGMLEFKSMICELLVKRKINAENCFQVLLMDSDSVVPCDSSSSNSSTTTFSDDSTDDENIDESEHDLNDCDSQESSCSQEDDSDDDSFDDPPDQGQDSGNVDDDGWKPVNHNKRDRKASLDAVRQESHQLWIESQQVSRPPPLDAIDVDSCVVELKVKENVTEQLNQRQPPQASNNNKDDDDDGAGWTKVKPKRKTLAAAAVKPSRGCARARNNPKPILRTVTLDNQVAISSPKRVKSQSGGRASNSVKGQTEQKVKPRNAAPPKNASKQQQKKMKKKKDNDEEDDGWKKVDYKRKDRKQSQPDSGR